MTCIACGHENRPGAKFCEECGAQLEHLCASCGSELRLAAKFCDASKITECRALLTFARTLLRAEGADARRAVEAALGQALVLVSETGAGLSKRTHPDIMTIQMEGLKPVRMPELFTARVACAHLPERPARGAGLRP